MSPFWQGFCNGFDMNTWSKTQVGIFWTVWGIGIGTYIGKYL